MISDKDGNYYVINFANLTKYTNENIENIREELVETERKEEIETIDDVTSTKIYSTHQIFTNETKNKLNQMITYCLEMVLTFEQSELGDNDTSIYESPAYSLAFNTLIHNNIIEKLN